MMKKHKVSALEKKEKAISLLFGAPLILKSLIFTVLCLIFVIGYSFTDYSLMNTTVNYIQFENYIALFNDVQFLKACFNTFYLMLSIPITMFFGFCLAYVLNKELKGSIIFRVIYYLPAVSSALAIGIIWKWVLNDEFGLLNQLLGTDIVWLTDDKVVKNSFIMKSVWGGMGGSMLLQLAGMQNISKEYYEAAELDGAGELTKIFKITLPLLSPVLFYMITVNVIGGLNAFSDNYIITSSDATKTVVYWIYLKVTQQGGKFGLASAAATLLGGVVFLITLLQFKLSNKWVLEE
jgi:multiple sugar transport system permease protein